MFFKMMLLPLPIALAYALRYMRSASAHDDATARYGCARVDEDARKIARMLLPYDSDDAIRDMRGALMLRAMMTDRPSPHRHRPLTPPHHRPDWWLSSMLLMLLRHDAPSALPIALPRYARIHDAADADVTRCAMPLLMPCRAMPAADASADASFDDTADMRHDSIHVAAAIRHDAGEAPSARAPKIAMLT